MSTNNACNLSNPVGVTQGGTGRNTSTAYGVMRTGTTSTTQVNYSGVGTSGNAFGNNASFAAPSFQSQLSVAGALVELSTQAASNSATISFTSTISNSYSTYVLNFSNVVPASSGANLQLVVSTNNGSSYASSSYTSGLWYFVYNSATVNKSNSTTAVVLSGANTTSQGCSGTLWMFNVQNGGQFMCTGEGCFTDTTPNINMMFFGANQTDTSVNAIQLAMSSGNISSGSFTLYGVTE